MDSLSCSFRSTSFLSNNASVSNNMSTCGPQFQLAKCVLGITWLHEMLIWQKKQMLLYSASYISSIIIIDSKKVKFSGYHEVVLFVFQEFVICKRKNSCCYGIALQPAFVVVDYIAGSVMFASKQMYLCLLLCLSPFSVF